MNYECPSCKMHWEDTLEPLDRISTPLCIFCSSKHTEKELINWQMDHLENIYPKHLPRIIRNFYRYVERNINILYSIHEDRKERKDIPPSQPLD
jgi:hypothetical protein